MQYFGIHLKLTDYDVQVNDEEDAVEDWSGVSTSDNEKRL